MTKTNKARKNAVAVAATDEVPMPLAAAAYAEPTEPVTADNTVAEVAKAVTEVNELIAARAAKWGFGTHIDAYLASVAAQKAMRKAKGTPAYAALHATFRELNRNKKVKYA